VKLPTARQAKLVDVFASIDRGILVDDPYPHLQLVGEMAAPLFDAPQPTRTQQMWTRVRRRLLQPAN